MKDKENAGEFESLRYTANKAIKEVMESPVGKLLKATPPANKNAASEVVDELDEAGFIAAEAKFNERSESPLTPFGSYLLGESIIAYLSAASRQTPETEKGWHQKQWQLIEALYQHSQARPVALTPQPVDHNEVVGKKGGNNAN